MYSPDSYGETMMASGVVLEMGPLSGNKVISP